MHVILYDGWPLVYQPNDPAAIHLLTLLAYHPGELRAIIALPEKSFHTLPAHVETAHRSVGGQKSGASPAESSPASRLVWEQKTLPEIARTVGAGLVHLTSGGPALLGGATNLISPAGFWDDNLFVADANSSARLAQRLRQALAYGGLTRASSILWPQDLPDLNADLHLLRLPPVVHPLFLEQDRISASALPVGEQPVEWEHLNDLENFILYHGPLKKGDLVRLLNAWSWAAGAIGEAYPLLVLGLTPKAQNLLHNLAQEYHLAGSVKGVPLVSMQRLVQFYRRCAAVFHPAKISPWGGALRMALSSGKPIISLETRFSDSLLGPAGYLARGRLDDPGIARSLGAALIAATIDEKIAAGLAQAARARASRSGRGGIFQGNLEALPGYLSLTCLVWAQAKEYFRWERQVRAWLFAAQQSTGKNCYANARQQKKSAHNAEDWGTASFRSREDWSVCQGL